MLIYAIPSVLQAASKILARDDSLGARKHASEALRVTLSVFVPFGFALAQPWHFGDDAPLARRNASESAKGCLHVTRGAHTRQGCEVSAAQRAAAVIATLVAICTKLLQRRR